ncbi:hypothetical protein BJ684DRAFT_16160 [Piptocephalis cylindrospora]|uniref:Uncharacterized protein n=1 Tax=Piptocephalis cylindrospora TaxID=1907219 RepID=A0A4V1IY61_9FUNG|nr:hypothetical protein BJ684DRAFT_16160 [Piptocephalis cylindrospora]|eukprot:RKP13439.1 hypothetical protein BJ684DRAFT_16160 [Piptocephalis cylindrospora]
MLDPERGEANECVKGLGEMLMLKSVDLPGPLLAHTADQIIDRIRQSSRIPFNQKALFDILGKYLQRLPQHALLPAAIAGSQGAMGIQARSGQDVLNDRILALSECIWHPSWIITLLEMIRDLSLQPTQLTIFISKGIRSLSSVELESAPKLIYQLLLLSRKTDQINVLSATLSFLAALDDKEPSDFSPDRITQTENSIFLYVGYAMRLDQKLGGSFLKWIKATRTSELSPHSLAILLMISEVVRYQDAAWDLIRSQLILAVKDTRRVQGVEWMKSKGHKICNKDGLVLLCVISSYSSPFLLDHRILQPPDANHILLFSIGRICRGWEQLAPPLLRLLFLLLDAPPKGRIGASPLHPTSPANIIGPHGSLMAWATGYHPELPPCHYQLRLQAIQGIIQLFQENVHMRADILLQCSAHLTTPTPISMGILEALDILSTTAPDTLFQHANQFESLMDILPFQSVLSGKVLVRILGRLAMHDLSFRGSLIIVLQKGLLSREEGLRQISSHGLLFLVGSHPPSATISSVIEDSTRVELLRKVGSAMQQDDKVCESSLIDMLSGPCKVHPEEVARLVLGLVSPILEPVDEGKGLKLNVQEIIGEASDDQKAFGVDLGPSRLDQRVSRAWSALPLSLSVLIACLSCAFGAKGKRSSKKGLKLKSLPLAMPLTIQSIRSLAAQLNHTDMSDWQLRHVLGAPPRSVIHPGYLHRASILLDVYTILMDGCLMAYSIDPSIEKEEVQRLLRERGDKSITYTGARGSMGLERVQCWFELMARGGDSPFGLDPPRQIAIGKIFLSSLLLCLQEKLNMQGEEEWGRDGVYQLTGSLLQLLSDPQGIIYQAGATTGQRQRKSGPTIVSLATQVVATVSWDLMMSRLKGRPIKDKIHLLLPQYSISLAADLGSEGDSEARSRKLLDVMSKATLTCTHEYVRLFKEAHRLMLHTQLMACTLEHPLQEGFYQNLLERDPFGDAAYGKRLLSRFLLHRWPQDVFGGEEEKVFILVRDLQSTLGLIEGNEETEEQLAQEDRGRRLGEGGRSISFPFILSHTAEQIAQGLLDALVEAHDSIDWSWAIVFQEYRKVKDGGEGVEEAEKLEADLLTQSHYLIRLVIELEKTSLPIPSCTLLLDLIQSLYETLAMLTKKHADVEVANHGELRRGSLVKKRRVTKGGRSMASTSKEIRIIPNLIYSLEQFEQNLIILSKKSKVDMTKHLRRSTARDFRIEMEHVIDQDEPEEQDDEENEEE